MVPRSPATRFDICVPKYLTPISLIYTDLLFIWVICIYKKVMWNSSIAMLSQYQCESKPWSIACTVSPHRCHGPTGSPQACTEQMLEAVNGQFGTGQLHQSSFPLETCTGQHRFFPKKGGCLKSSYSNLLGKGILKMAVLMGKIMILGYIPYVHQDNERTSIK